MRIARAPEKAETMAGKTVTLTVSVTVPVEVYNLLRFMMETGGIKDPTDEQIVEGALGLAASHAQTALEVAAEMHGIVEK